MHRPRVVYYAKILFANSEMRFCPFVSVKGCLWPFKLLEAYSKVIRRLFVNSLILFE